MNLTDFQVPLWAVAIIVIVKTLVLINVHPRMQLSDKLSMAIPGICFGMIYLVLSVFPALPIEWRRFSSSNGLAALFTWYAVLLWRTRKQHGNV